MVVAVPASVIRDREESPQRHPSNLKSDFQWFGPGSITTVCGIEIQDAMSYVGTSLVPPPPRTKWGPGQAKEEPSLINPSLKVEQGSAIEDLPYSPSYMLMSRRHRYAYLQWLASGRRSSVPQSYLYLFLYGIERRLLWRESPVLTSDEDEAIYRELTALCAHYPEFTSARATAVRLLAATWPRNPLRVAFDLVDRDDFYSNGITYKYALGCLGTSRFTIEHALQWIQNERPNLERKVIGQRCWPEIFAVFRERISMELGEGIDLHSSSRTVTHYRSVTNPTLYQDSIKKSDVKEASEAGEILGLLSHVCLSCVVDLEAASKRLGVMPSEVERRRTQIFLPDELRRSSELARSIKVTLDHAAQTGEILTWRNFQKAIGIGEEKLTKAELKLYDLVEELGFVVEPDPREGLLSTEKSSVFATGRAIGAPAEFRPRLRDALLVAWLTGCALGPSRIADVDLAVTLESAFSLTKAESERVHVFARWLRREVPKPSKATLDHLADEHRSVASQALLHLTRGGHRDPLVIKEVTRTLIAWGWKQRDVFSAIHAEDIGLVVVREAAERTPYAIPNPESVAPKPLELDMVKVQLRLAETEKVTRILGDVFLGEESEVLPDVSSTAARDPKIDALSRIVFAMPVGEIGSEDFGRLVASENFMAGAAVEAINDLAFEMCDAPLIHGDGPYELDAEILEELKDGLRKD